MIPSIALSVRQPWAWAIIHAGKDIENRSRFAVTKGELKPRRIAIHAAKGMTRDEYLEAASFMWTLGVACPAPTTLDRGGIIGAVDVVSVVKAHASPWFFGPCGLVLANAEACNLVPSVGSLGYFTWRPADASIVPHAARWMLPKSQALDDVQGALLI